MSKKSFIKSLFVSTMTLLASSAFSACTSSYTVTFDTAGGTEVESITVKHGSLISEPETSRTGYDLDKWTCEGKKWRFSYNKVTSDITLVANWNINKYTITYNYNGGYHMEDEINPSTYTVEDEITFINPRKEHYSDCYWTKGEERITGITKGTTGNITLDAHYDNYIAHNLTMTNDPVQGDVYVNGTLSSQSREFLFDAGEEITLKAVPNTGSSNTKFIWKYWYDCTNQKIISTDIEYTYTMPDEDITIWAAYETQILYSLTVSNDPVQGQAFANGVDVGQSFSGAFAAGDEITLKAVPATWSSEYEFVWEYWYDQTNKKIISTEKEFTYIMPSQNITIWAEYTVQAK